MQRQIELCFPHSKDKVNGRSFEVCWNKEIKGPHLSLLRSAEISLTTHTQVEGSLVIKKGGGIIPEYVPILLLAFALEFILTKDAYSYWKES